MIDYEEDCWLSLIPSIKGSVLHKAFLLTIPSILLSTILIYLDEWSPGLREDWGFFEVRSSQLWGATTSIMAFLIMFRTRQAYSRFWEGTGLLHQMRGEWFDTVSNVVTFSITARPGKPEEVLIFRHAVVRIMSLCHGSALEEIAGNNIHLESIDTFGLDDGTLNHLQECHYTYGFNKVEVMLHLLQSMITTAHHEGILNIPAPILSRVYQTISRGFVNLLNAKKIQDTKFPFPYAQLIAFLLVVLAIMTPIMMSILVQNKILCAFFTFIPMFGLYSLNCVAIELEDPFGTDDNDLPLQKFQEHMNNCLMMLLHPNADLIATVSDRAQMDFHTLRKQVCLNMDKDGCEGGVDEQDRPVRRRTRRLSDFDINTNSASFEAQNSPEASRHSAFGIQEHHEGDDPRLSTGTLASLQERENNAPKERRPSISSRGSASSMGSFIPPSPLPNRTGDQLPMCLGGVDAVHAADAQDIPKSDEIPFEMDNVILHVGKEPSSTTRHCPRTQSPRGMLSEKDRLSAENGAPQSLGASLSHEGHKVDNGGLAEMANIQPLLAKNMEDLISSLDAWTKNINKELNALQSNSSTLQKALHRFSSEMPSIKEKVREIGSPNRSKVGDDTTFARSTTPGSSPEYRQ